MLFFVGVWLPLLLVCWLCGAAVLERAAGGRAFARAGDRLVLSLWLGLVILAQLLLTVSHFSPLTPLCGALVAVVISVLALLSRGVREEAARLKGWLKPRPLLGLLALALGVAACAAQPVTFFDTGLYHFQHIRWLSDYGAVRGLGLVHDRFAFTPAWFALAAPFDAGPFETRAAAVACGFALLVAALHALVCARRCAAGEGRGSDWLAALSYALVLPPVLFLRMPPSASPDMPVFFLVVTVAWCVCVLEEARAGIDDGASSEARLVPLLLAAGAVGVKLNALPLLVVACVYYVWRGGLNARRVLLSGAMVALLLLPTVAHRFFVSGCPLYPSKVLCVDVPWSVGVRQAEHLTRVIRDWARWEGTGLTPADGWGWVVPWATKGFTFKNSFVIPFCLLVAGLGAFVRARTRLRAAGTYALLAGCAGLLVFLLLRGGELLMVVSAAAAVVAALTRRGGEFAGRAWVLAAGLAGTALTLYAGPALRFGLGYTAILFGALLVPAVIGLNGSVNSGVDEGFWRRRATLASMLTVCGLFFFVMALTVEAGARVEGGPGWLLLPPRMQGALTTTHEVNGLKYLVPASGEQCWAAELPCAPRELPGDVTLRDPARGPRAGFVRTATAPNR
ncbi:MAG TPA: hypothetical protein VF297_23470 [Pyrinomonadaceae bacterium]